MAVKTPIRTVFDGSNNATGLAEFQSGEFIGLTHGGLGASLTLGTAGQVLKVNSGATALEFSSDAGIGLTDLSIGSEASASGNGGISYNNSTGVFTYTPPVLSGLTGDTDDISEGSSNLYLTNERVDDRVNSLLTAGTGITLTYDDSANTLTIAGSAQYADSDARSAISVTDSGGDGSLAYNNSTGVITYTGPSASEVRTHISGGTGVTITDGSIAIGQAVGTSSNVQFNNATIDGNLTVNGTTTTVSSTNTTITDKLVELANGQTGTPSGDIGHVFERGNSDNAFIGFDESEDKFIVGTGTFTGASTGNLTITKGTLLANLEGNVTGDVTGNADTATALETARNIAGNSFDGSADITIASTDLSDTSSIALLTSSQTLTNKTLTSPQINTQVDFLARAEARFQDTSGGQYVALKAPATVSSNVTFTLPAADGSSGQVIKSDGSGNLSFTGVAQAGFSSSTLTIAPGTSGNFDLTKTDNEGDSETPFDSTSTDTFGVAIGSVFDLMEPTGNDGTTTDFGAFS